MAEESMRRRKFKLWYAGQVDQNANCGSWYSPHLTEELCWKAVEAALSFGVEDLRTSKRLQVHIKERDDVITLIVPDQERSPEIVAAIEELYMLFDEHKETR